MFLLILFQSLLDSMNEVEEIAGIRDLQKNWIGTVDGYEVLFNVKVLITFV